MLAVTTWTGNLSLTAAQVALAPQDEPEHLVERRP
ncbi:MAG: hypothetical protein QOH43_2827 [Solirubrobacteraceae bacterium]|jgi:hypothetical protein|nr:hypothetical protein [Solirubrobacteraceae bacterium]